jgi:protein TonB
MEQRMLAHLANEPQALRVRLSPFNSTGLFTTSDRVNARRSTTSLWTAIGAHAVVFFMLFALAAQRLHHPDPGKVVLATLEVPPPVAPKLDKVGGGGGQKGSTPVTEGHLPKLEQDQLVPPKAPPMLTPKLAIEPSVVVQPDLKMADNKMPDLGVPNSNLRGFSMGNGSGSGIGSSDGTGIGPGTGSNTGMGPMHVGGSILAPSLLYSVEPEFSEEARKAKFSGDVQVYLWVDEHGNPSHIRVVRGVGMGLDEKAVEAVRQYKFKPALQNGKPVKVDLYVNVDFRIF